ncbi:MAG: 50S ribosomal protein L3 [Sulfolobaceae archaeon]
MGHRKLSSPRRGSSGLRPRKRAKKIIPTVKSWPIVSLEKPTLLGFLGYKVGMTHVIMIDDYPNSPNYNKEVFRAVTVIETPPVIPLALRAYHINSKGELSVLSEYWIQPPKELELERRIKRININPDAMKKKLDDIISNLNNIKYFKVLIASQPKLIPALGKKTPDLLEVKVDGGDLKSQLDYILNILGKPLSIREVFREGQFIDIIGVTKGKGFQGVIKRFGVQELPRWHKHRKGSRKVGAKGPSIGTPSYVPQPGQMGFHRRTEYNKRILKISDNPNEINPKGGFIRYGLVKNTYIIIEGSTIGSKKRPLVLRYPIRPVPFNINTSPKIVYINLESQQG